MTKESLALQARKIDEYRRYKEPFRKILAGITYTVLPGVYPAGTDSELLCEAMKIEPGDTVLDLCTGTGLVALKAALFGAGRVVTTDLNPLAVQNARTNIKELRLDHIEAYEADLWPPTDERFDVITINPPYTDNQAPDKTAIHSLSSWTLILSRLAGL